MPAKNWKLLKRAAKSLNPSTSLRTRFWRVGHRHLRWRGKSRPPEFLNFRKTAKEPAKKHRLEPHFVKKIFTYHLLQKFSGISVFVFNLHRLRYIGNKSGIIKSLKNLIKLEELFDENILS